MNQRINDEAVYRTAPATPGLLIIENGLKLLEIGMGIWGLPIGSSITRFPGLVFNMFSF